MHINIQPVEKQALDRSGNVLDVHSVFHTIQGEGPFCGRPAVFVRLAGCNLQCPGCDTDYTKGRQVQDVARLVERIIHVRGESATTLVVITGGEPFRQDVTKFTRRLLELGFTVQFETNGTLYVEDMPWDHWRLHVVCSPKAGKINPKLLPRIDAFKYVLAHDSIHPDDGLPVLALGHSAAPRVARPPLNDGRPVYVQPMDAQDPAVNEKNLRACIASCMRHGYILQLQVHKLINME